MKKIADKLTDLIGNTPLVRLNKISDKTGVEIIAKLEQFNPGGSIKDRTALSMIEDAEEKGLINKTTTIIEPTSGNTGIGLAWIAAVKGYKTIIVMPDAMSQDRQRLLSAFGAELELTDASLGMQGAIDKAHEIAKTHDNVFIPQQFENAANSEVHTRTTAKEIWRDTDGKIDIFISGIGTGGTITGVARELKRINHTIQIIGVEPQSCAVLSNGKPGQHVIQGIGAGFVPKILDTELIDSVIPISDDDALEYTRKIAQEEGILCGISSGALVKAAEEISKKPENKGKLIVLIFADTGERYVSLPFLHSK
ncbi:MAG: cysteine synthase A [Gammaproteobacteria bacterium]|nr:MAG: cysteine synthase A [Gammaproteobacteria bacterium]